MDESCERQLLRWKLGLPDDYFFKQCEAGEEASARHTFLRKSYPQLLSCHVAEELHQYRDRAYHLLNASIIPARETASPLTANCPPIFSIWFGNCRDQAGRAGESGIRSGDRDEDCARVTANRK